MKRCQLPAPRTRARSALVAASIALGAVFVSTQPLPALAQIQREAPRDVVLGRMKVTAPPMITMDDKPDQLSPGARIRDTNNMLALSGSLTGRTLGVVYKRDSAGLVHEVWLLTDAEYEKLSGKSVAGGGNAQAFIDLLAAIFGARR